MNELRCLPAMRILRTRLGRSRNPSDLTCLADTIDEMIGAWWGWFAISLPLAQLPAKRCAFWNEAQRVFASVYYGPSAVTYPF